MQPTDLDLALHHVVCCAVIAKPCAVLLDELRRLYAAAGEPIPSVIRPPAARPDSSYTISADPTTLRDPW